MRTFGLSSLAPALLLAFAPAAHAHLEQSASAVAFIDGLTHPFAGVDHLAGLFAAGLLAWQVCQLRWALLAIMAGVGIGGVAASGLHLLPDPMLLASFLSLAAGFLVLSVVEKQTPVVLTFLAGFSLFQGAAHVAGMPGGFDTGIYSLGVALSSALLLAVGGLYALLETRMDRRKLAGLVGAAVAVALVVLP